MRGLPALVLALGLSACGDPGVGSSIKQVAIAPGGDEIVFRYSPGNKVDRLIRYAVATGAGSTLPQPGDEVWANPVYSSDGQWLAVGVYPDAGPTRLDVMRPDGRQRHTVVTAPGNSVIGLFAFSPDGGKLLFSQGRPPDGSRYASHFDILEADIRTGATRTVVKANFYQLSGLAYLDQRYAYVGMAPFAYSGDDVIAHNSHLFISDALPDQLEPAIRFSNAGSRVLPSQAIREIESLRVSTRSQQMFVALRDDSLPERRQFSHYIRDIYELKPDHSLHRLTRYNSVQFYGFDVTPDGRYLAVIPDQRDVTGAAPTDIYRIDLTSGEQKAYRPDAAGLVGVR